VNAFSLLSNNLISWAIQISVIAGLGAALPMLFRIRHPRTQLAFLHLVLAFCILLPLMEPWQHPLRIANETARNLAPAAAGGSWITYLLWVIAAGLFVKLCWLAGGLWQIRRYRSSAVPVFPIPESIRQARLLTRADARFGISNKVDGPASLGHVDPIVLLPELFLTLDHSAQLSIVCHELIHVRRNDWLVTLFEEIIGTIFWFIPSIWLLLSQTKLCREQIIDAEVVSLTAAPEPYVHALLAMSGILRNSGTVPAAFFLTDGHLHRRVRSLLTSRKGSIGRLAASYALIACLLMVFTIFVSVCFPLIGGATSIGQPILQRRVLHRALFARSPLFTSYAPETAFNVRAPEPEVKSEDILYYTNGAPFGSATEAQTMPLLEPPTPFPGIFFGMQAGQVYRTIRPGDMATPEDIARMQAAFGDGAQIEVQRTSDGAVQRLTILRRSSPDESGIGYFGFGIGSNGVVTAGPASSSDSVH